ncbi:D-alanyl-D-alanine carboxypeptidase family protein [Numidum massiliense]|uniref:D-alanyl-D-alanine carboxypeptidase family protein n=1 Tax=Numidum massiliense TaxID=1522315 RepID=UPI0006D53C9F|nr:D-alanyl-D-alanine carboxypeptidase family protein [Numidum massiliense]
MKWSVRRAVWLRCVCCFALTGAVAFADVNLSGGSAKATVDTAAVQARAGHANTEESEKVDRENTVADTDVAQPEVSAKAAVLVDVNSGRVLYEKNADEQLPIASITKIMTAIVAIEHGNLDDIVTVSPRATRKEGSSVYLKKGERISLRHLLYGLMLRSGNDTAVAIAEFIGKSEEGFVTLMNEKAEYLGMTHSHFANPHGLDAAGHYSSARDMATLTRYALANEEFQKIVATHAIQVPDPGEKWNRKWYNKNKMLSLFPGADGVKTGYTSKARRTLVASATQSGQQLVTVTLNAPDDWRDSSEMLAYGFRQYPLRAVVKRGEVVHMVPQADKGEPTVNIVAAQDFQYPLTETERTAVAQQVHVDERLVAKVSAGAHVGTLSLSLHGKVIGSVPLTVQSNGQRTSQGNSQGKSRGGRQENSDANGTRRAGEEQSFFVRWLSLISPVWGGRN